MIFGGCSPEHEVSMDSAACVIQHMDLNKYNIIPVCITREGKWLLYDGKLDNFKNISWEKFGTRAVLSPDRTNRGLLRIVGDKVRTIPVDIVFPVLHGVNGEDGSIQGLCQLAGIPCVGSGVTASAVCMDKAVTKKIVSLLKIDQAKYFVFKENDVINDMNRVAKTIRYRLGYPCFIKPAASGSSIGVTMINNKPEAIMALEAALEFSDKVIAEEYIKGREIECGVFGDRASTDASVPGEIIPDGDFYDYGAKYISGKSKTVCPAEIPDETANLIREYSVKIYNALDIRGTARADFFLEESGRVVFNEINTIPGFTPVSMYPMAWEASGMSFDRLVDRMIESSFKV
jgi:D-alanine-D-alanine ligase